MTYKANVPQQVIRDIDEAVFYKTQLDTYPENIAKFINRLNEILWQQLETNPKFGSNLKTRIDVPTEVKYIVVGDYILFYEVEGNIVNVLRLLPAKSNWMSKILNYL